MSGQEEERSRQAKDKQERLGNMSTERDQNLEKDLAALLNRHSREGVSGTPDFVLVAYLMECLRAYEKAVQDRIRLMAEARMGIPMKEKSELCLPVLSAAESLEKNALKLLSMANSADKRVTSRIDLLYQALIPWIHAQQAFAVEESVSKVLNTLVRQIRAFRTEL